MSPPPTTRGRSGATTATRDVGLPLAQARLLLLPTEVIASPESRVAYRIERLLGEGGFGQVYLAQRLGRSTLVPRVVCIKASTRIDGLEAREIVEPDLFRHFFRGHDVA